MVTPGHFRRHGGGRGGHPAARPHAAYDRELQRILWFVKSARRVKTTVPIHVVVGPERDEKKEALLLKQGVRVTVGPVVEPPRWASKYHRLTFSKLGALALKCLGKYVGLLGLAWAAVVVAFALPPAKLHFREQFDELHAQASALVAPFLEMLPDTGLGSAQ